MAKLSKVRVQLLDEESGTVLQEVDVLTSADSVTFEDGETFQQKLDLGKLKGEKGDQGIPGEKGDKGETGANGQDGASDGFGTVTATVDNNSGTPSVVVDSSGNNTAKNFTFKFSNLKGQKGDTGEKGEKGENGTPATVAIGSTTTGEEGTDASVTNSGNSQNAIFNFTIPRGQKGDKGDNGKYGDNIRIGTEYESAQQGKLFFKIVE